MGKLVKQTLIVLIEMRLAGHMTDYDLAIYKANNIILKKKSSEISDISYFSKSLGISFVSNNNFRLEIG